MTRVPARRPLGDAVWLGAYALVTLLAFPHRLGDGVYDAGWLLAWFSPALLMLGVAADSPGVALRRAGLASLAAHSAILHWIFVVTVDYGHAPVAVGVVAPIGLAAYMAVFSAGFAFCWRWLAIRGIESPFVAAALWTVFDHGRAFVFTGFPWATIGYAQHENPALLGLASITGVYGLSFVTALVGAALAAGLLRLRTGRPLPVSALLALAVAAALHGVGWVARPPAAAEGSTVVRMAALQGNIEQGVKWDPEWAERTLAIYEDLTRRAAQDGAAVIVWPETAVPGAIEVDPALEKRLARLSRETGAVLIVGGVGATRDDTTGRLTQFFDSAFFFEPSSEFPASTATATRYDKSHLVPFGEYVPMRDFLGRFIGAVARGIASRDVTAGPGPAARVLHTPQDLKVGVPICYELLFPDLVRRFAGDGAQVLLAVTNDAWYGRTGAPYQFLAITALRSAETGLWTVRAANTGVSAFIDARGVVQSQTEIFERGWIAADVPLAAPQATTFYVRHGDVFTWGCWLACAASVVMAWRQREQLTESHRRGEE